MGFYHANLDWTPAQYYYDPVAGDASAISDLSTRYSKTATAIQDAADALKRVAENRQNKGKAVDEFAKLAGDTGYTMLAAKKRYDEASSALSSYAATLRTLQSSAVDVLDQAVSKTAQAQRAQSQQSQLDVSSESYSTDSSQFDTQIAGYQGEIRGFEEKLREFERQWDTAGNAAADAFDTAFKDGLTAGWLERAWDGLVAVAEFVSKWAGVLALAFSWVPVLGQLLTVLAVVSSAILLINEIVKGITTGEWDIGKIIMSTLAIVAAPLARVVGPALKSGVAAMRGTRRLASAGRFGRSPARMLRQSQTVALNGISRSLSNPLRSFAKGFAEPFAKLGKEASRAVGQTRTQNFADLAKAFDKGKGLVPGEFGDARNVVSVISSSPRAFFTGQGASARITGGVIVGYTVVKWVPDTWDTVVSLGAGHQEGEGK